MLPPASFGYVPDGKDTYLAARQQGEPGGYVYGCQGDDGASEWRRFGRDAAQRQDSAYGKGTTDTA